MVGCFRPPSAPLPIPPVEPPPASPTVHDETDTQRELRDLRAYIAKIDGQRAEAIARAHVLENAAEEESWAWAKALARWLVGLSMLAFAISAALAIYFRSKFLAAVCGALVGMIMVGLVSDWILRHRTAACVGFGVVLAAVLGFLWWESHQRGRGLVGAIKVAEALKPAVENETERAARKLRQSYAAGTAKTILDRWRARAGV